ncbi:SDR family NAD(P)-dependent oxidoreductase, partial [Rhizobium ruizarguesonis]|uniref:SDR family NAD(P)-dependent oxidoreductase n=1 Tax=Rhizobium ruizarguesonis TaxID=2081791 RepID=UPI0013DF3A0F
AYALSSAGASVAVGYHSDRTGAEAVAETIRQEGGRAVAVGGDVSDPQIAVDLVRETEAQLGPLGIVVKNAGTNPSRPLDQITAADWDETIRVNLTSAFHVTQAAVPGLRERKWGRIITISSVAAQLGGVIGPHYAASKAGLIGLAHYYAAALAK